MRQQINWSEIDQYLSDNGGNDLIINYKDLINLINNDKLILTTPQGKRIWLNSQCELPEKTAWLDSGLYNYGENTIDVKL
jgi:hypothetical protein